MSDAPSESKWLYGIHDPGGEHLMLRAGRPGWVVISQNVGHDPDDEAGQDFRRFRVHRLGGICRLDNGRSPYGTIPVSSRYDDFAERCANFVGSSRGCSIWIIGNEPNAASERPAFRNPSGDSRSPLRRGQRALHKVRRALHSRMQSKAAQAGDYPRRPETEIITPQLYAECYGKCRDAIHQVPGHEADQVLVAAIAPWNSDTRYAGNEWGDWVVYFQDVLSFLGSGGCDGFDLHTSTHQSDPRLISSSATMNAPYQGRHMEFRAYRDFLEAVPNSMRRLPVYVTQAHQGVPWHDANTGWVQTAYDEIDGWNRMPGTD